MRYLLFSATAIVLLFGGPLAADPVSVTSGTITFTDEPGSFDIAGDGFDVAIGWFPALVSGTWWTDRCAPSCDPASTIDFGTTTYTFSEGFQGNGGSVNGVEYPALFTEGDLTFVGPSLVPLFSPDGAFTFHGNVSVFTNASRTGPPIFAADLIGRGTAHLSAGIDVVTGLFEVTDLGYTFTAVPEPSTLAMLASGLIGAGAAIRRRRGKRAVTGGL